MSFRTNPRFEMQHPLPPRSTRAIATLYEGGTVLLPTANLWQLVAASDQDTALKKIHCTCPPGPDNRPELIFPDLEMLTEWCPRMHPKLQTLVAYHRRALTLIVPAGPLVPLRMLDDRGEVAVRLAMDSFVYRLCEDLELPLAASLAMGVGVGELPTRFGKIRSDVLRAADFTVQRRQREDLDQLPAVRVTMRKDDIVFLD